MEKIINHIIIVGSVSFIVRKTPSGKPLLNKDESSIGRKYVFCYRAADGMLSYLQG